MTTVSNPIDRPKYPVRVVYDTAAVPPVQGATAAESPVICAPAYLQIATLPANTTIQVQRKVHSSAAWVNVGAALTSADGDVVIQFNPPVNFVRISRTVGTGHVKAYAQDS